MWNPDQTARITLFFRDYKGSASQSRLNVDARDLIAGGNYGRAIASLFAAVTSCAVWKVSVSLRTLDVSSPPPDPGSNTNRRSVFVFGTASAARYVLSLPGLDTSRLVQPPAPYAGIALDISDVAVAALIAATLTGIGGIQPCAPWLGDDITEILAAYWGYEHAGW